MEKPEKKQERERGAMSERKGKQHQLSSREESATGKAESGTFGKAEQEEKQRNLLQQEEEEERVGCRGDGEIPVGDY